ncbi:MAG: ABC transporter permease subunit [Ruthenibacterium lactatiformans]
MLVCLWLFCIKPVWGSGIRASAYDTRTAGLMGLNVNMISLLVFAISDITAGLAGLRDEIYSVSSDGFCVEQSLHRCCDRRVKGACRAL